MTDTINLIWSLISPLLPYVLPALMTSIPILVLAKRKLKALRNLIDSVDDAFADNVISPDEKSQIHDRVRNLLVTSDLSKVE